MANVNNFTFVFFYLFKNGNYMILLVFTLIKLCRYYWGFTPNSKFIDNIYIMYCTFLLNFVKGLF